MKVKTLYIEKVNEVRELEDAIRFLAEDGVRDMKLERELEAKKQEVHLV